MSRTPGWSFRGIDIRDAKGGPTASTAWLYVLGVTPGAPTLTRDEEDAILEHRGTPMGIGKWLIKQHYLADVWQIMPDDAVLQLKQTAVFARLPWYPAMRSVLGTGFVVEVARGRPKMICCALVGYDPEREAWRAMLANGPGWGHLGRCWIHDRFLRDVLLKDPRACLIAPQLVEPVPLTTKMDETAKEYAERRLRELTEETHAKA